MLIKPKKILKNNSGYCIFFTHLSDSKSFTYLGNGSKYQKNIRQRMCSKFSFHQGSNTFNDKKRKICELQGNNYQKLRLAHELCICLAPPLTNHHKKLPTSALTFSETRPCHKSVEQGLEMSYNPFRNWSAWVLVLKSKHLRTKLTKVCLESACEFCLNHPHCDLNKSHTPVRKISNRVRWKKKENLAERARKAVKPVKVPNKLDQTNSPLRA